MDDLSHGRAAGVRPCCREVVDTTLETVLQHFSNFRWVASLRLREVYAEERKFLVSSAPFSPLVYIYSSYL